MAGGDFMLINETGKQSINLNYESDLRKNFADDCKNVKHINTAIYVESFHDNQLNESESYELDLSTVNEPSTCRTTIVSSDSGSYVTDRTETLNNSEVRYINSAIFIAHIGDSCDEEILTDKESSYQSTYRKTDLRQTVQPIQTHTKKLNGKSVVNLLQHAKSASNYGKNLKSKSSTHADMYLMDDGNRPRGLTFDEWLASKQQLTNRPKINIDIKTDNKDNEQQRRRRMDEQREDFKRWLSIKREQEKIKKKELEMKKEKLKREEELKNQRAMEKESMLKSWIQRKDEQLKEKKRREEMEIKKREEEKKMRKELSAKAFEEWKEKSKYNPRPVPLNMGIESLRGSLSAIQFVNPTPWQENIDLRQSSA